MKYIVLLGDGMADYPLEELQGKTPLMAACTPNLDFLAQHGTFGRVQTIPPGFPPGSDVANLAVLGYDPQHFYTGRAPLEAASMRLALGPDDVAFRCNFVTLGGPEHSPVMEDFSAGHIPSEESHALIDALNAALKNEHISFHPGVSYRHVMVWRGGNTGAVTTPPHDISGQEIAPFLPCGDGAALLLQLMERSQSLLADHPVNQARRQAGKKPATSIWLWGQGKTLTIPSFQEKYRCSGAVISAVDLIKGIGIAAGLDSIEVPGATGFLDTNYRGKAEYAVDALGKRDFVYVHVEAPDEAGHSGNIEDKVKAIENFDEKVVGTVLERIGQFPSCRVMVLPDHATPIRVKTHTSDVVPFVIYPALSDSDAEHGSAYDEVSASKAPLFVDQGHTLMDLFIHGTLQR